jgi:hypothetical protein
MIRCSLRSGAGWAPPKYKSSQQYFRQGNTIMIYYNKDVKLMQASCEGETRRSLAVISKFHFAGQNHNEMVHNKYTDGYLLLL